MGRKPYPDRAPQEVAARRARIIYLSRMGWTVAAIAAEVGVGHSTVTQVRREEGLSRWRPRPFTHEEDQLIRRLLDDGASYNEVARTADRRHGVIARRYPGYGWSMAERDDHMRVRRRYGDAGAQAETTQAMWALKVGGAGS